MYMICLLFSYLANTYLIFISQEISSHKKICVKKIFVKKFCKHCDLITVFVCNCFIIKNGIYLLIYCNRVHLNISKQQLLRCYINREKLWIDRESELNYRSRLVVCWLTWPKPDEWHLDDQNTFKTWPKRSKEF